MTSTPDDRAPGPDEAPDAAPAGPPPLADTQPITTRPGDTQPLTWSAPAPPPVPPAPPGTATPPAAPGTGPATPYGTAPYGTPHVGARPPAPQAPYGPTPQHGAPPHAPYGTPPQYGAPQHGAPQLGAPQYGAPGYGAPTYGAPGQPVPYGPTTPTDGLAVGSLVTSVGGLLLLLGLTGPVGIGLGIGALARIRRTGARGRGMAIAGIVVGAVGTVVLGLSVWALVAFAQWGARTAEEATDVLGGQGLEELLGDGSTTSPDDLDGLLGDLEEQLEGLGEGLDEATSDVLPAYTLPQDVTAGTCWETVPEYYDLSDAVVVPCTQQHEAEVVAVFTTPGPPATDLTVEDPVLTSAYEQCDAAVAAIDPGLLDWGTADVWLPHPDQVAAGQTVAYCVYEDTFGSSDSVVSPAGISS